MLSGTLRDYNLKHQPISLENKMKPKTFRTDPELLKDTYKVAQFELSDVYVKNDKSNPWFVLVPRKNKAIEIVDLNHEEQSTLMEEITVVSEFLKNY